MKKRGSGGARIRYSIARVISSKGVEGTKAEKNKRGMEKKEKKEVC